MNLLRLHVATTVALSSLLVLLVIVGLNFLAVLGDQLGDIRGQYTIWNVLQYGLWRIPGIIADATGFVAMIGCLVGLGVLSNHNELTVMRASGVSLLQIVGMVILPVLVLVLLGFAAQELAAYADRQAENARIIALSSTASKNRKSLLGKQKTNAVVFQEKAVWNRQENEFIRFDSVLPDGSVYGVTRIGFDDNKKILSIQSARAGVFENGGWRLEHVRTQYFSEDSLRNNFLQLLRWDSALTPERLLVVSQEPEKLAVSELTDYSAFLQEQGRDNRAYQLEYWKRLLQPASLLSLMLIAVSFVFGSLRQVSVAQRVFIGVIAGMSFHILQDVVGTSSLVFGFSPLSAVLLPIVACAVAGMILIYRAR